ncbi:cytochrome P450 [Streptomyces sp. ODS28]|uniref:cytochrome P450 n=1 Tax=Streptomyces sp. ODS28 TaxID=3136688 RepID=UPI0031E88B01
MRTTGDAVRHGGSGSGRKGNGGKGGGSNGAKGSKGMGSIPLAAGSLPLVGHTLGILRSPLDFLSSLPAQGDLVRVRVGPLTAVVVCDPALTRMVLLDDATYDRGGPFYDRVRESMGESGLGTCLHERHRRLRRLMQPAFHTSRLPGYAAAMTASVAERIGEWRDGQALDVTAETHAIAVHTLTRTMVATALTPQQIGSVVDDVTAVILGMTRRMVVPAPLDRLPSPGNRRYWQAMGRLRRTFGGIIAERRADGGDRGDLLSALLDARDPESGRHAFSDAEVMDQIMTLFLAGSATTANGLTNALYLLTQDPGLEAKLHAEVDEVLGGGVAALEHLPRLAVTRRIVTEILRAYPPAWLLTRVVAADTTLGGHPVPAGATVVFSPYVIHRRGDLYPEPCRFDPDRWAEAKPPRDAFFPYGAGARKCVGDQFGEMETALTLASIASRWLLRPPPGYRARPSLGATLGLRKLTMTASLRGC